ncbi:hypothetical protein LPU83_pLPU83d_1638 (plasmid) [Rhizobium favelukesii]|uniref:Uncharacterized protein n=1 Tax=Rhizobium favelukesii TaxID=348824 RepID=W6RWN7_9HYPH|nr:hypothetical protein LPU83_pLPU83d_1638 [Rhizobium favelukesii]
MAANCFRIGNVKGGIDLLSPNDGEFIGRKPIISAVVCCMAETASATCRPSVSPNDDLCTPTEPGSARRLAPPRNASEHAEAHSACLTWTVDKSRDRTLVALIVGKGRLEPPVRHWTTWMTFREEGSTITRCSLTIAYAYFGS